MSGWTNVLRIGGQVFGSKIQWSQLQTKIRRDKGHQLIMINGYTQGDKTALSIKTLNASIPNS